ncbi:phosphatidylglycerophosphatase [Rodentibacter trehalosifermentans]|uniref:undecaprenyl-diphosphate phosphatase n=1 Tax=Rodentibacter trehalosifermentans TaxID=1908263 RepID=A0A1V3IZ36_9PAST|nr:phosphatase PAP2 family protein [Rodentibacter trehalosifermentans]OOF47600.1 phosphatidylglycerophosphatase [Rodentibacter trehalosifermentans]
MFKRLSLYTLLLCLVPFFIWSFSYQWQGNGQLTKADYWLYLLTETGSVPYALITCGVFALMFSFLFKSRKQWLLGVAVMAFSVVATQAVKTGLKAVFKEPRPFTVYLAEHTNRSVENFYENDRTQRAVIAKEFYSTQTDTPAWLVKHYEDETGYSFPSGHTIFAATWLMLAVGFTQLLGQRSWQAKLLVGGMAAWSLLILISRVRLGMHYPIDLLVATLFAWLINLIIFSFLQKKRSSS